jgi:hypothetical protein
MQLLRLSMQRSLEAQVETEVADEPTASRQVTCCRPLLPSSAASSSSSMYNSSRSRSDNACCVAAGHLAVAKFCCELIELLPPPLLAPLASGIILPSAAEVSVNGSKEKLASCLHCYADVINVMQT